MSSFHLLTGMFISLFFGPDFIRKKLEKIVQKQLGSDISVFAFGSARSSLALCLQAIDKRERNEVLMSAYTCLAVPTAGLAAGFVPRYCDIDIRTLNIDIIKIIDKISPGTGVVLLQHTLGSCFPVVEFRRTLKDDKIILIEDCALSVGSVRNGIQVGSIGDAAIFSMELSKTISTGWGGVLIVRNKDLVEKVRMKYQKVKEPGFRKTIIDILQTIVVSVCYNPIIYNLIGKYVIYIGYNKKIFRVSTTNNEIQGIIDDNFIVKLSGAQSWLAVIQWKRLYEIRQVYNDNFNILYKHMKKLGFEIPGTFSNNDLTVTPRISFLVKDQASAMTFFAEHGIELGLWFNGPLSPKPSSDKFNYSNEKYPCAGQIAGQVVNLPCHGRINNKDVNKMKKVLELFAQKYPENIINL